MIVGELTDSPEKICEADLTQCFIKNDKKDKLCDFVLCNKYSYQLQDLYRF